MKKTVAIFASILSFLFVFVPVSHAEKDYNIDSAYLEYSINRDGSASVLERRVYDFDGSFSWAEQYIELSPSCDRGEPCEPYKLSNISIAEGEKTYTLSDSGLPYTYELEESSDRVYLKWHYKALNEVKTFDLRYTIDNAVTNHQDVSEFYWKMIGSDWDKGVSDVFATITLPYPVTDGNI
mgnify:FL=1